MASGAVRDEADVRGHADARGLLAGALVELVLHASDESEDVWEIGDRVDALIASAAIDF